MAAPVALLTFQLALVAWSRRNRETVFALLRTAATAVYGRELKPWQVRAYRYAALVVAVLTVLYDAVSVAAVS